MCYIYMLCAVSVLLSLGRSSVVFFYKMTKNSNLPFFIIGTSNRHLTLCQLDIARTLFHTVL